MKFLLPSLFIIFLSIITKSQTITGCRTEDGKRIYYVPANPSKSGTSSNVIFNYSSNSSYPTNYSGTDIPCTIKNPMYYATGQNGDYGQCIIKFASGNVAGQVFKGQLTPCNVPIDDYIPFLIIIVCGVGFFSVKNNQLNIKFSQS